MNNRMRMPRCLTLVALAAAMLLAPGALSAQTRDKVVVASKIDTEGALLGNLILIALERAGVPVENRLQLGPTKIVRTALVSGEIDLYPEYTGNGAFFFNKENDPAWKQAQSAYDLVKKLDLEANKLVWLDRAPANNTWLMAGRDQARRLGRVRREPRGPAVVRAHLRLHPAARPDRGAARRRHGGDHAG